MNCLFMKEIIEINPHDALSKERKLKIIKNNRQDSFEKLKMIKNSENDTYIAFVTNNENILYIYDMIQASLCGKFQFINRVLNFHWT